MRSRAACSPRAGHDGRIRSGLSVVAFDGFEAPDTLKVRYLDCVDGTPLIDIKPYLKTTDCEPDSDMGWLEQHATRRSMTVQQSHRPLAASRSCSAS